MNRRDTKSQLLDVAERLVQTQGYSGFSFHDLARMVGITTASIHYHFPTKAALGQNLVRRYTENFLKSLGEPERLSPPRQLQRYTGLFRKSLRNGRMCLCGMVGMEVGILPGEVAAEVRRFFLANARWLTRVLELLGEPRAQAVSKARKFVATLEGAMLISRATRKKNYFDEIASIALTDLTRDRGQG